MRWFYCFYYNLIFFEVLKRGIKQKKQFSWLILSQSYCLSNIALFFWWHKKYRESNTLESTEAVHHSTTTTSKNNKNFSRTVEIPPFKLGPSAILTKTGKTGLGCLQSLIEGMVKFDEDFLSKSLRHSIEILASRRSVNGWQAKIRTNFKIVLQ